MRQTVFSYTRFLAIQASGKAHGRDLLMLIEEIQELQEKYQILENEIARLRENCPEDEVFS